MFSYQVMLVCSMSIIYLYIAPSDTAVCLGQNHWEGGGDQVHDHRHFVSIMPIPVKTKVMTCCL